MAFIMSALSANDMDCMTLVELKDKVEELIRIHGEDAVLDFDRENNEFDLLTKRG